MAKVLVVYFSRSGNTRAAARRMAEALDADLEVISESTNRTGPLGYLRSGREAFLRRKPPIGAPRYDPSRYELVIVASPIWNFSLASPVRTYLSANRAGIKRFAALLTCGGMGSERVIRQMEEAVGRRARVTAVVTDLDRARDSDGARVDDFVETIRLLLGEGATTRRPLAVARA